MKLEFFFNADGKTGTFRVLDFEPPAPTPVPVPEFVSVPLLPLAYLFNGVTWNLHPTQLWPVPAMIGGNERGVSVRFVADQNRFPKGVTIGGVDERQPTSAKNFLISTQPNSPVPVSPQAMKEGAGTTCGPIYLRFGTDGVDVKPYDVVLVPGREYFINVFKYDPAEIITPEVSIQFVCYERFS